MLEITVAKLPMRAFGGSRLCFFKASLTTPRWPLAVKGSDGCESQVKQDEKENEDVVGRTKGNGILAACCYGGNLCRRLSKLNRLDGIEAQGVGATRLGFLV
jgi:hypothetical protein